MSGNEAKVLGFPSSIDSSGFSEESQLLENLNQSFFDNIVWNYESNIRQTLSEELVEITNEGTKGNFDHYGANPVLIETYEEVKKFISLFPFSDALMKPDILIEPDGSLELDWENEETDTSIALSFSGSGVIYYAGLFKNGARSRGVENFDGIWIPKEIIRLVQRVVAGE